MTLKFNTICIPHFSLCSRNREVRCGKVIIQILIPSPREGDTAGPVLHVDGVANCAVRVTCGVLESYAYLLYIVAFNLHRAEVVFMRYGDSLTVAGGVCSLDCEHRAVAVGGVVVLAGGIV